MSINSIASLSGIARGGWSAAATSAQAPDAADQGAGLDLDLDLDLSDLLAGGDRFAGWSAAAAAADGGSSAAGGGASALGDKDENGSGTGTFAVGASGNQGIDGLLSGVAWSGGSITYSFPDSSADYQAGHPELPFVGSQLSAAQQLAVHFALNDATYTQPAAAIGFSVEGFTNLGITWTSSEPSGTIRLINSNKPGTAYAYYPDSGTSGGDAFFGPSGSSPVMGNYHWHTVLHEIGHSLGLKHGQETSGYGALPSYLDSMEYSVMTYRSYVGAPLNGYTNETYGYAQTYMMYDIAALQYMYGADFGTNSGDTVYSWTPGSGNTVINGSAAITPGANRIFMTVWDGGGIDTYDASAYTTGVTINLAPGGYSLLSSTQQAYLGGGNYARGNVFNALQYYGDARSLIENATGGSGADNLYGNAANNVLTGNAGNDYMWSSTGDDTLYGGDGDDLMYGAEGNDYNTGDAGNDYIWSYDGNDTSYGGTGNDTVIGGTGNDYLDGGDGNDSMSGDAGDDYLIGGNGNDSMVAGDGNDWVYAGHGNTIDAVADGGAGNDGLYYGYLSANGYTFDDELGEVRFGGVVVGTMVDFEIIYTGYGNDIVISDGDSHVYYGLGGNDTMFAGLGGETMYGGTGIDTANMTLFNGDYLYNMSTGLTNYGDELYLEFERVIMGAGNDTVIGTANADTINGGAGVDSMEGLGGNDVYYVSTASDLVVEAVGGGNDAVFASSDYTLAANVENLTLLGSAGWAGTGNGLNNKITGNSGANLLDGLGGRDNISGGGGADTLLGGGGNDKLNGGGGNDFLDGVNGNDRLIGGDGNDRLDGGVGADTLSGNAGADSFIYRAGADLVTDFLDDVDTLLLDDALWGGGLTVAQVLATYANVVAGDTIFNFGGGATLTIAGLGNKGLLSNDIVFV